MKIFLSVLSVLLSTASAFSAGYSLRSDALIYVGARDINQWNGGMSYVSFIRGRQGLVYETPRIPVQRPEDLNTDRAVEYCMIETDTAAFTHWDLSSGVVDHIQAFEIPTAQLDLSLTGSVYSGNVDGHRLVKMNFNIQNKVVASPLSGTLIHPDTDQSPLLQGVYCQIHAKPEIDESSDQTILRALGSAFGSIFRVVH